MILIDSTTIYLNTFEHLKLILSTLLTNCKPMQQEYTHAFNVNND